MKQPGAFQSEQPRPEEVGGVPASVWSRAGESDSAKQVLVRRIAGKSARLTYFSSYGCGGGGGGRVSLLTEGGSERDAD